MVADGIVPVFSDAALIRLPAGGSGSPPRPDKPGGTDPRTPPASAWARAEVDNSQAGRWARLWQPAAAADTDTPDGVTAGLASGSGQHTVPVMPNGFPHAPHATLHVAQPAPAAHPEDLADENVDDAGLHGHDNRSQRPPVTPLPAFPTASQSPVSNISARDTGPALCSSARLDSSGRLRDAQLFAVADLGPYTRVRLEIVGTAVNVIPDPDAESMLDGAGRVILPAGMRRQLGWKLRESIAFRLHPDGHLELRSLQDLFEAGR